MAIEFPSVDVGTIGKLAYQGKSKRGSTLWILKITGPPNLNLLEIGIRILSTSCHIETEPIESSDPLLWTLGHNAGREYLVRFAEKLEAHIGVLPIIKEKDDDKEAPVKAGAAQANEIHSEDHHPSPIARA